MAWHRGRSPWWAVVLSGTLLAGTVVGLTDGSRHPAVAVRLVTPWLSVLEQDRASVTFVGDSWTVGRGATELRGYAVLTGEQLDWDYDLLGVGGSGYSVAGSGDTFDRRIDRAVATAADVIVVQGSLNERRSTPEALVPAAEATLARLAAETDPETRIVVLGASYNPGTSVATIDWINDAIESAAYKAGLTFVDVAEENWTDPDDPTLWADPVHPNDKGYQVVADRLTPLLRAMVDG